jgi:hypothetical protein
VAQGEEQLLQRCAGMLQSRAAEAAAALATVDARGAQRDDASRRAGEAAMGALVAASLRQEKVRRLTDLWKQLRRCFSCIAWRSTPAVHSKQQRGQLFNKP